MSVEPSLDDIKALFASSCDGAVMAYHFANSHLARTDALECILEFSYDSLVRNRHLNKDHSEDALSIQIVEQLRCHAIQSTHDTQTGGHCDIHVEGKDHFLWIGEAKIHSGYDWLISGFEQLSTRYATGSYGQDRGEIIIYCRTQKASETLKNWKNKLIQEYSDVNIFDDQISTRLWFRSKRACINSGNDFFIRHRIIPLYWERKN